MAKSKKGSPVENVIEKSITNGLDSQELHVAEIENPMRILFRGKCPKLSSRGVGDLEYELGINDITGETSVRIAGNASSGAFNNKWVSLKDIRSIVDMVKDKPFKAVVIQPLYRGQSSNNHGYLSAILKAEGVFTSSPDQMSTMQMGSWDTILAKIDKLKITDISLTDHIAMAEKLRAEKKARNVTGPKTDGEAEIKA